ncbi:MAG: N-terminal phage integrase SAM-like domain-containing protein, partial [Actinomycetota bacterium]|nr:N-terminal phage integrase SAM-like domain-containing protein [Actinomycetota bacterium]
MLTHPEAGHRPAQVRRTTGDYLEDWLAGVQMSLEISAWTNYRSVVELYLRPRLGHHQLTALTAATVTELYAGLLRDGGKHGKALSPTT